MKSLKVLSLLIILLFPSIIFAVSESEFQNLMSNIRNKDYSPVEEFLDSNKGKLSRNPEYYVVLLNYVISKGYESRLIVAQGAPKGNDFVLRDEDTGEVVGFMGSRDSYDEALIVDGITQTQKSLNFFRSRMDIHFGIVAIAERIERWDIIGNQLVNMLETSRAIENKWTWGSINSMKGDPEEFMIQNILPRTAALFRAENPKADEALINVSQAMIDYYPGIVYGYANLGVLYLAKKEYDRAEEYFNQALKIDPNDEVILGNLEILKRSRK